MKFIVRLNFLLILSPLLSFGQNKIISGKVLEYSSMEPIVSANVYVSREADKTIWGTVTDLDGKFTLEIPAEYADDTLRLSHIGFKSIKIKSDSIKSGLPVVFYLQEEPKYLQTVTVRSLSAKEYILKCIEKKEVNYFNINFSNECFFWQ